MTSAKNTSAIFNSVPQGYPVLGETIVFKSSTIDLETVPLSGGVLVKALYLSIDPYLRGKMRDATVNSYSDAYRLGKPILGYAIVSVVRSEIENVHPGDILYVLDCPFEEYTVLSPKHQFSIIKNEANLPLSVYLGVLGMPGETAFYGLEVVGKPVKGETIFVSSGASAVGSLVIQLGKAKGLRVIASAGSKDKVAFMKSIGADVAFDYKTENVTEVLSKEGPIDIYWDNVGGSTLEDALDALNMGGRVVNATNILYKRLRVEGFFVFHARELYEGKGSVNDRIKFFEMLVPLVKSGEVRWAEQTYNGIESVGEGIISVLTGGNIAKVVIKVADV